ncbi:MAG: hypothetical protein RI910_2876 [Verrucomicrobiota bacterium]
MQVDFLIVGQGLAGSLLAKALLRRGRTVHVVDDRWKSSSSQVAAGLMTPLTGRRFTLTKDYPELFASAQARLTELGVFRPIQVYRMFVDDEQRAKGLKRTECASCQPFIARVTVAQGELDNGLTDTFGGALMNGAWVDLPKLMADVRAELIASGSLTEATFEPADAVTSAEGVVWGQVRAGAIVYCDGYKSAERGPFKYLPWQPAKGEALTLKASLADKPFILNREGWALPQGQGVWRTGTNWQSDVSADTSHKRSRSTSSRTSPACVLAPRIITRSWVRTRNSPARTFSAGSVRAGPSGRRRWPTRWPPTFAMARRCGKSAISRGSIRPQRRSSQKIVRRPCDMPS